MTKKQHIWGIIWGVSFVWFTTHFGGGFASGAQIYSYFVRFGIWALFMPALAMAYNAFFFAYALRFARKHEVYDYKSYNDAFYGKFSPIFSNLFELLYLCVMCVAPAVAFATGGATLSTLTGLPYLLCTLLIGAFIFVIAVFGTDLVRKVASVLSICIIVGLLIVYIPNIIHGKQAIADAANTMTAAHLPFGKALYSAFLYGTFQLANIAVFVQHAKSFEKPNHAISSMVIGGIINSLLMIMVVLGIMTVYTNADLATQSVPTLFMVQNGTGKEVLVPLISVLIILGSVSTAVNMVAAMVTRIDAGIHRMQCQKMVSDNPNTAKNNSKTTVSADAGKENEQKITGRELVIALVCCLIDFGIAQFGLLTLIQRAYSILAYLAIPVILIPYIVHMIATRMDTKDRTDSVKQ